MAKRRGKNGRFTKSKSRSRKRRGMGSIISVRKGSLGQLGADAVAPPLLGGGAAALTTLALRYFVDPMQGTTQQALVRWAPLFGLATGSIASLALYMMGGSRDGARNAMQGFLGAAVVAGFGLGADFILKEKGGSLVAAVTATAPAALPAGTEGFGAIVPEYSRQGMGAIVMEPTGPGGQRPGSIGSYGESVTLQGVNTGAFGTPGFQA
jgi:hypothetical protein